MLSLWEHACPGGVSEDNVSLTSVCCPIETRTCGHSALRIEAIQQQCPHIPTASLFWHGILLNGRQHEHPALYLRGVELLTIFRHGYCHWDLRQHTLHSCGIYFMYVVKKLYTNQRLRSSLFWDVAWHRLADGYQYFTTTHQTQNVDKQLPT